MPLSNLSLLGDKGKSVSWSLLRTDLQEHLTTSGRPRETCFSTRNQSHVDTSDTKQGLILQVGFLYVHVLSREARRPQETGNGGDVNDKCATVQCFNE